MEDEPAAGPGLPAHTGVRPDRVDEHQRKNAGSPAQETRRVVGEEGGLLNGPSKQLALLLEEGAVRTSVPLQHCRGAAVSPGPTSRSTFPPDGPSKQVRHWLR